ncbi:MAG TPA: DUF1579 family protein [Vicinamibacteria bacterium]
MSDSPRGTPRALLGSGLLSIALLVLVGRPATPASETRPLAAELRFLEPMDGRFKVDVSWGLPGNEPQRASGTCLNRFILGSRFLQSECTTTEGEQRSERLFLMGFDERKRQFFLLVLDESRGYYFQPWGHYDQGSRSFILSGKERDETSGRVAGYRLLLKVESPKQYRLEAFFDAAPSPPVRFLEATYTRLD